jgi:hypothetical protein
MGQMMLAVEHAYVVSGFWSCGIGTWDLFGQLWFNFSSSRFHAFALAFHCNSCTLLLYNGRRLVIQVFPLHSSKLPLDLQINYWMHTALEHKSL